MIGAIEKQKFVYVLNRDTGNRLTISSPLEAHSSNTIVYGMVGIDVGYENPMFACLELDHGESDQTSEPLDEVAKKVLTFYELDLSLNHVVKKISKEVEKSSFHLIAVPGGTDGPGGVLICSDNKITYRNSGQKDVVAIVPRRLRKDDDYSHPNMIVASSTIKRKQIIFFIQNEEGDLFKLILDHKSNQVSKINIFYFDTIPVAISICILIKSASIFVASEFGNHKIYQFKSLGQDENSFASKVEFDKYTIPLFKVQKLKNLQLKESINSLSPIIEAKVVDLFKNQIPNIYAICGRSENSSLRVLRHGLPVEQFASVKLPANPISVWTVKKSLKEEFDNYIVLAFSNRTMVFSIGKEVAQVTNSGFETSTSTLSVSLLGKESILQVHPTGLRQIKDVNGENKIIEWENKKTIVKAVANESQVIIALSGGEIIYFELNQQGILVEIERKDMGQDIACLAIGSVPEGRIRSRFLAVGLYDKTVRIFSLDPEDCLQVLTRQAIPAEPESLTITEMNNGNEKENELNLYIGLNNGVLIKNVMDPLTGELFDTRARYLGSKPLRLVNIKTHKSNAVLALSSRSWLSYYYQNKFQMTPLSHEPLQNASNFSSEQCPEGLVAITGNTLVVFSIKKLGEVFNQKVFPLKYTPRKFTFHPKTKKMIIIETDHNAYKESDLEKFQSEEMEVEGEDEILPENEYGKLKPNKDGKWASYIRIVDTNLILNDKANEKTITTDYLELKNNEAAFTLTTCEFSDKQTYLIVGVARDLVLYPQKNSGGYLNVYKFNEEGTKIELLHQTELEDVPTALCEFQGRLLVGMGKYLRVYDLGKKKLLKKSENKSFPNKIISISHSGKRIYVGDIAESFHFVKFKEDEQFLSIFADNTVPRWLTASTTIDYSTVAGADKFGNIFISRLPQDISDTVEDDPTSNRFMWERGFLGGAPQKAKEIVSFHVGETVTSLCKANFVPGTPGVLLYFTVFGTIGCLVPFSNKEDVDFFSLLETHIRQEGTSLVGRDHLSFVSYYYPVQNCIDGDLLDTFEKMTPEKQKSIADELDRTPSDIKKKLQDIRNLTGF
jgi:splicing factor 3B subunit 3